MKKIYIILILFFSCSEINQISKPDNLIDENKMSKILYDIAIMKSINGSGFLKDDLNFIFGDEFIYKKYNIDSAQLSNSYKFYSSNPKKMMNIYLITDKLLEESKDSIGEIIKEKNARKIKNN
tara:strand:- start:4646 stop:5014 length:369 start_codon:yes stop_codon:yes gene_type:complete